MYYKITNTKCAVYKKLHKLRTAELQMEKDNHAALDAKIGLKWKGFLGHYGQQNINRTNNYCGFEFKEPKKVDPKIWKQHKEHKGIFVPNRHTKLGREMDEFLRNGLKGSAYFNVLDILKLDQHSGSFTFPYVEIVGKTIVLYLDEQWAPKDKNLIEITKKEFLKMLK